MNDINEQDLGRLFGELRRLDATRAPAFDRALSTTHAARRSQLHRRRRGTRAGTLTAVLATVALAFVARGVFSNRDGSPAMSPQSVLEWRPRSDALLAASRTELFTMMQPLGSSVLDSIIP